MKRLLTSLLCLAFILGLVPAARAAQATPSPQTLTVEGEAVTCDKYNIDGSNYFKLRDLAYLLNGTTAQFAVYWDAQTATVSIETGLPYDPDGTELVLPAADLSAAAEKSEQTIRVNGVVCRDLSVYNIGGNNFFQLRELGRLLGFAVDYDARTDTAMVSSEPFAPGQDPALETGEAWVGTLAAAQKTNQLILVSGQGGSDAILAMYQKGPDGTWTQVLRTEAYVGRNGFGKTREGDAKTPRGLFHFTMAFGIAPDPGSTLPYTQVTADDYWCGDSDDPRYNQFVTRTPADSFSLEDSEHIIDYTQPYQYCLNISYNEAGRPHLGSAIFLHCFSAKPNTGGCVAVSQGAMVQILRTLDPGCLILIDEGARLSLYQMP